MADKILADRIKKLRDGIQSHTKTINPSAKEKQTCTVLERDGVKLGAYETNDGEVVSSWANPNYRDIAKESMDTSPSQIAADLENDGDEVNEDKVDLKKATFSYTDAHNPDNLKKNIGDRIRNLRVLTKAAGKEGVRYPPNIASSQGNYSRTKIDGKPAWNLENGGFRPSKGAGTVVRGYSRTPAQEQEVQDKWDKKNALTKSELQKSVLDRAKRLLAASALTVGGLGITSSGDPLLGSPDSVGIANPYIETNFGYTEMARQGKLPSGGHNKGYTDVPKQSSATGRLYPQQGFEDPSWNKSLNKADNKPSSLDRARALLSKKKEHSNIDPPQQPQKMNIQATSEYQVSTQPSVNLVKRALAVCAGDIDILAQAVGVTDQSVYKWMIGETKPSLDHMRAIQNFLTSGKRAQVTVDTTKLQAQNVREDKKPEEKDQEKKPIAEKPEDKKEPIQKLGEKKDV